MTKTKRKKGRAKLTPGSPATTWKIRTAGGRDLLIDPWLAGNPAAPEHLKKVDSLDLMVVTHGHGRLRDCGAGIQFRYDVMHGAAGNLHPCVDRLLMHMRSLERGQQRRMDVDQPPLPFAHEVIAENPHEPRKADQFRAGFGQARIQRGIERIAEIIAGMFDHFRRDAGLTRAFQPLRARDIRYHQHDSGGECGIGAGIDERLQIAPATGDQHRDS